MRKIILMQRLLMCGVAAAVISSLFSACWTDASTATASKASSQQPSNETAAQELIDHPERYDGKEVTATGIASIEFENTAIRSPEPSKGGKDRAVWLEFSELKPEYKKFDRQRVQVRGIFHAGKQGHFGMFDGAITDIKEIKIVSK